MSKREWGDAGAKSQCLGGHRKDSALSLKSS